MFYWVLKHFLLGPALRLFFRPWVEGIENVPETGPAILASNHLSFSDSVFLPLVLPRQVIFLAKSDYFTGTGIKGRLTAMFFKLADQLPIDRSGGRASEAALRTGMRVIGRGELLGIYPEGTRSPDGRLYRGRTGVARMALEARVPVIPVAMIDTEKLQPPGKVVPHLMRPGVRIGKPLDFSRYEGMEGDRFVLRSITDEIMYELMQLSGQEYVDVYASAMKARLAEARRAEAVKAKASSASTAGKAESAPASAAPAGPPTEPTAGSDGAHDGDEPPADPAARPA